MSGDGWVRAAEVSSLKIGDKIVSCAGVEVEVLDIRLVGIHRLDCTVLVLFSYDDNGRRGIAEVVLSKFLQVLGE